MCLKIVTSVLLVAALGVNSAAAQSATLLLGTVAPANTASVDANAPGQAGPPAQDAFDRDNWVCVISDVANTISTDGSTANAYSAQTTSGQIVSKLMSLSISASAGTLSDCQSAHPNSVILHWSYQIADYNEDSYFQMKSAQFGISWGVKDHTNTTDLHVYSSVFKNAAGNAGYDASSPSFPNVPLNFLGALLAILGKFTPAGKPVVSTGLSASVTGIGGLINSALAPIGVNSKDGLKKAAVEEAARRVAIDYCLSAGCYGRTANQH